MKPLQFITSFFRKEGNKGYANGKQHWSANEILDFTTQLKQVIKWTEKLSKDFDFETGFYGTVFRQTNPSVNGTKLYSFDGDYATWNLEDYDQRLYEQLLEAAINSRDKIYHPDLADLENLGLYVFRLAVRHTTEHQLWQVNALLTRETFRQSTHGFI